MPFRNLDGIGPADNTAFTDYLKHFVRRKNEEKKVTREKWHVICDTWLEVSILSKCRLPSSFGCGVKTRWAFEEKDDLGTESMSYKGVWRTALATPGVLKSIL